MKKAALITFLSIFIMVSTILPCHADQEMADNDVNDQEQSEVIQDEGGAFERIIATIVEVPIRVIKGIGDAVGMESVDKLIFMSEKSDSERKIYPWIEGELKFIKLWYLALSGMTLPFLLVAVVITSIKLMASGVNPGARTEAISSIWRWFGAIVIILLAPLLIQSLMMVVLIILDGIQEGYKAVTQAAGINRSIGDWSGVKFGEVQLTTGSVLGTAIVKAMFLYIYLWFNTIYIVRKLVISVMLCFTPIMAVLWAFNKNVNAAPVWLGEIASNAFMPIAHALVLCLILGFCDVKNIGEGTWFTILVYMYTLIPLAEVLRNSLQGLITRMSGLNEETTAKGALLSAVGLGGIMSLGKVGKASLGGNTLSGVDSMTGPTSGSGLAAAVMQSPSPAIPGSNPGPNGGTPAIYATTAGGNQTVGSRQIGFTSPNINNGYETGNPGGKNSSADRQPQWVRNVMLGANIAGRSVGGLMSTVSGAVPGGKEVSEHIGGATSGAIRFLGVTGGLAAEAALKRYKGENSSVNNALKEVTGVKDDGLKGTAQAVMRVGQAGIKAARGETEGMNQIRSYRSSEQNGNRLTPQKQTIGFRAPGRGLK